MLRNLQRKFIAAAMLSVALVLFAVMGTINLLSYRRVVNLSDNIAEILLENEGYFPAGRAQRRSYRDREFLLGAGPGDISPEAPFETRFFTASFSAGGELVSMDTGRVFAVSEEQASEYARNVFDAGREKGFISTYRFAKKTKEDGSTFLVCLDCWRSLSYCQSLLLTSLSVVFAALLGVYLLLRLFSGRAIAPMQETYDKQKQFVTDAGHELKTPLTIIEADVDCVEMDTGKNEFLDDVRVQTRRLADLTSELIMLSRMEEAGSGAEMIAFSFSDVVAETAQSFQNVAQTQGKTFESRIEPMMELVGDENSIRKLVSILLDNAVKYCQEGGRISLTAEKRGKNIRLEVFNTCEAIEREALGHLFERFYRTDKSRNSRTGGYGIGLAIAQAVVHAHKGRITATTEDEKSLLITVIL